MSVFSAVGYLYGDAGLKDLFHKSGVFAARTVNMMLAGKDFDKAMYGLKLVDEACTLDFISSFSSRVSALKKKFQRN